MSALSTHSRTRPIKPSRSFEGFFLAIAFLVFVFPVRWGSANELPADLKLVAYHIQPIPFKTYQDVSGQARIPIIFSQYGEIAKVIYPAPVKDAIQDTSLIIKKCQEAMLQNVPAVLKAQTKNKEVNKYLTLNNQRPELNKEGFLNIVRNPQEMTVQRAPGVHKVIAEFRSKEFEINKTTSFCIYVTFVCSSDQATVEKIILSAVKLEI